MPLPIGVYRADQVGSLLRPKDILSARAELPVNSQDTSSLRPIEDKHISDVVRKQLQAGLRSVTDGEFRRAFFHLDFLRNLEGVTVEGGLASTNTSKEGFIPPRLVITGKVKHVKPIQLDDFLFLEEQIANARKEGLISDGEKVTTKVAIPSPTMCHFRGSRETISSEAYPGDDLTPFFSDLAKAYQVEIKTLYDAGCRFLQLDDTNLAYLCDPEMRAKAGERHGVTAEQITEQYASLINAAISERPKDMVIGIHLCRGNHRSQWFAQGGYEPVAQVLFEKLNVDVYFLEYDDARSGDFAPLRFLPEEKVVVLGVMSSKKADLDDKQTITKRLKEAASHVRGGLDQLCLSHQCGFSSTMEGNELSEEQQWEKVKLEVELAKHVWGQDISN
ncbi:hypothetical protein LTR64_000020 [Lithohypha guttulata]|uniref:uncharacterized protein n=1 Tax=Lithohypha guttulata TaxID=1690604 RepID=UPI002DDE9798|nr:hypothetical protein LTR51_007382 [Lithohypha guttulata]